MKTNRLNYFFKSLLEIAVCFLFMFSSLINPVSAEETSGKCGDSVNWSFSNGILKIEGNGKMDDYSDYNRPPWYEFRNDIVSVIIENDVDSIGSAAFYDCDSLGSVIIGNDVTSIGSFAFLECEKLTNVRVGSNVKSLGQAAFKMCTSLESIVLPSGLTSIGHEAFFLCQSLKSITIPSSVTFLGECVFSYCESLLQVNVNADLTKLPDWTFYDCGSLVNVTLSGSIEELGADAFYGCNQLKNIDGDISSDLVDEINQQTSSNVGNETNGDSTVLLPNDSDQLQQEVIENDDIILNGTIGNNGSEINATINTNKGWQTVIDKVDEYTNVQDVLGPDSSIDVNVTIQSGQKVDGDVLSNLAGTNTNLVIKGENIIFEIDCNDLVIDKNYKDFKLDYTLELISNPNSKVKDAIGDATGFYLKFKSNIDFNVTVKILLGKEYSFDIAALYQKDGDWNFLQSVTIDQDGYASFYFASFDIFTKYLIGINVEGIESGILPESMYDDYEGLMDAYGNRYVITGSESRWGLTVGQVTLILATVLIGTVALIGGSMWLIFKRKQEKERIKHEVMSRDYKKPKKE